MKRSLPWIYFGFAVLLLVAVVLYIQSAMSANQANFSQQRPPVQETALDVSVVEVNAAEHAAAIQAVGIANANQNLALTTQISGEVIELSPQFEVGQQVSKGQVLLRLKNIGAQSDLASAQNALANAELAFKEEQRQADQANAEWRAAGLTGDPASDLVLRAPQLAAARAELSAAKAALTLAQDNVKQLTLRAPFDAIIVSKDVALGAFLGSNTQVATLYSTDQVVVELQLSLLDWQKLPSANTMLQQHWSATVNSVNSAADWSGYVKQAGLHVDSESGLRSLFVAVDQPLQQSPALIPGSFVKVDLKGATQDNLWQLPNSALSQKSEIWYLDQDNRLANFDASPEFVDQEFVYIKAPEALRHSPQKVLVQPYNSYLKGMLVNPQQRGTP
ncbi:Cobalt-zinc-cadmium resistance protein CzcB [Marinomonas aquimarina]|uniref:Cobalt-zinc-cadmium resistance protein CzcB n=1 Tax=Marinomonas aquimarina TaxID=295068 RepID=A0A1A8T3Z9_9GAMM|nr:efflux RND transporter periplasmic adaptor subunit [Marinomonas aquimarina]SBS26617.1 Cobalt-zinc-cadmium resistance protein CzcB [Marinomonas aquimarina]